MRLSRQQMFMEMAHVVAKRSTCCRLNVGAIVVHGGNNVVSIGYNGPASGEPHCAGNACPGRHGCAMSLHAEANAIERIPPALRSLHPSLDLYSTDSPCIGCCDCITESNVDNVYFSRLYRVNEHLFDLVEAGVNVFQITPAGYIIDWSTGNIVEIP